MAEITLELIANMGDDYGSFLTWEAPLHVHVHNRVEKFAYLKHVRDNSVPISYIENEAFTSWRNLHVANRTYQLPENAPGQLAKSRTWDEVTSTSYTSLYYDSLVTDQKFVDQKGRFRPLFWKHTLPANTVEVSLRYQSAGNKIDVEDGYVVSLEDECVYTNYSNFYDPDTGAYKLFWVASVDESGVGTEALLAPEPVVREGTWEDIDTTTGTWKTGSKVFSRSSSGSGTTLLFASAGTYYIKPIERSLIQPKLPFGRDTNDSWFMRFTSGAFVSAVNGSVRSYSVPEFYKQSFSPYSPIRYTPYAAFDRINSACFIATRTGLNVNPDTGLHVELRFFDEDDVLVRVLTTNTGLDGDRYSDTEVFYESDQILSWDPKSGILTLGVKIPSAWSVIGSYYYDAEDLEYTKVDLNPLIDGRMLNHKVVYYMVPNPDTDDRGIQHLVVDEGGYIVETSQSLGFSYPNLQLRNSAGGYNGSTVIGMRYSSDDDSETTFIRAYTAGYSNQYGYSILCEAGFMDLNWWENQLEYDVRRTPELRGKDGYEDVIKKNPKVLQSIFGYGEDGQEVPTHGVVVHRVPITLLEDYGGSLKEADVRGFLKQHLDAAVYPVVEWEYENSQISIDMETAGQVDLSWTWEDEGLTYILYRRNNPVGTWEEIYQVTPASEVTMTYTDTDVNVGDVFSYGIRILEGTVELPRGNVVTGKVH